MTHRKHFHISVRHLICVCYKHFSLSFALSAFACDIYPTTLTHTRTRSTNTPTTRWKTNLYSTKINFAAPNRIVFFVCEWIIKICMHSAKFDFVSCVFLFLFFSLSMYSHHQQTANGYFFFTLNTISCAIVFFVSGLKPFLYNTNQMRGKWAKKESKTKLCYC